MSLAFSRLERVINLEIEQGYQNKAVVGGIRQFAVYWVEQAREEAVDEADRAFVEQTAELLMDYGSLSGVEARKKAVDALTGRLKNRRERVGDQKKTKPKRQQKPPKDTVPQPSEKAQPKPEPAPSQRNKGSELPEKQPTLPEAPPDPEGLSQSVQSIKGVGPKIAEKLDKLGAQTVWDLLYIFPRRYDDFSLMKPIRELQYGEQITIIGTIWETRARKIRGNQTLVQSIINDGTGSVQATWFNQPWLAEKLKAGLQVVISGKVDQYLGRLVFNSPEWEPLAIEPLKTRRIVPVYPLTQGLNGTKMRDIMRQTVSMWAKHVPETLPESVRKRQALYPLPLAIDQVHFPQSQTSLHDARRRLAFDELFLLQLGMLGFRRMWQEQAGLALAVETAVLDDFRHSLPYSLTGAQERVIGEILDDMSRPTPMNRLLQGDVGAGKTVVAAAAMIAAVKAGAQAALMAPTEILAEQHFNGLNSLLTPLGINTVLLTGSTPAAEKAQIYAGLADGSIHIAIGTHALIQEAVRFRQLGLAVIDEQHRFGVDQRQALRDKGAYLNDRGETATPHVLVMSATPIPRTLALSLYGDLDFSLLDEMPPGRQEIKTRWLRTSERERAYAFTRRQVEAGRQAYIIYPLVEESDKIDAKAAVEEYERLQTEVFPDLNLGLVHGRLPAEEKETAMRAFYQGETQILVATSVIEVGVDVPNSTIMIVEGANRFGLAQLHQFRGRVGRGEHQSYCMLIADKDNGDAEERLTALEKTNDGFALAEKDLEIRGPGEFFGRRQSGIPELQLASILDMALLASAREEAELLLQDDPELQKPEHEYLQARVSKFWEQAGDVS